MISNIITGLFLGLGCFTFVAIVYFLIIVITDKIKRKTAEKRRLKKLDGKIDKINKLMIEIRNEGGKIKATGKYLCLEDVLYIELSEKEIK